MRAVMWVPVVTVPSSLIQRLVSSLPVCNRSEASDGTLGAVRGMTWMLIGMPFASVLETTAGARKGTGVLTEKLVEYSVPDTVEFADAVMTSGAVVSRALGTLHALESVLGAMTGATKLRMHPQAQIVVGACGAQIRDPAFRGQRLVEVPEEDQVRFGSGGDAVGERRIPSRCDFGCTQRPCKDGNVVHLAVIPARRWTRGVLIGDRVPRGQALHTECDVGAAAQEVVARTL
eukprot:7386186-Prymnesium_polylepis.1